MRLLLLALRSAWACWACDSEPAGRYGELRKRGEVALLRQALLVLFSQSGLLLLALAVVDSSLQALLEVRAVSEELMALAETARDRRKSSTTTDDLGALVL